MIKYKLCSFLLYLKIQTIHLTIEWIKIGFIIIIIIMDNNVRRIGQFLDIPSKVALPVYQDNTYDNNNDDDDSSHNKTKHKTPNSFYRGQL